MQPLKRSYLEKLLYCFNILFIFILQGILSLTAVCMVAVSPEVEQKLPPHWEIKGSSRIQSCSDLSWHRFYLTMKQNQIPDIGLNDNNIEMALLTPTGKCQGLSQLASSSWGPQHSGDKQDYLPSDICNASSPEHCTSLEIRFTALWVLASWKGGRTVCSG